MRPSTHSGCLLLATLFSILSQSLTSSAEVRLPGFFSSHMVLQRDKPMIIWGWAQPNESVTVTLNAATLKTQANSVGEWKITLAALKAGGPYTLEVRGSNAITLEDVMVGEVWLASGQSNMEMGIGMVKDGKAEIASANIPALRLLMVPNLWSPLPQTNISASWQVCSPTTVAQGGWSGFSAAAYFFGRELNKKLGVTIGLIDATWGGTRIESWTPPEGFAGVPQLKHDYELVQLADPRSDIHRERLLKVVAENENWLDATRKAMNERTLVPPQPAYPAELQPPHDVQNSTALYNGMVHPLKPFAIRGAIWYQGESNSDEGMLYAARMRALVEGWRKVWGQGDFPFYFVQIAPYNYGGNAERIGEFWEAQAAAAHEIPNTGMAVITDIGDLKDIHPANKQEVGHRLALLALKNTYGESTLVASGPAFKNLSSESGKLRVTFDNVGSGLSSRDGKPLNWFEVIDADTGGFVPAEAAIDGPSVVLSSREAPHPVAMRFAWSMLAEPNLINSAGLPAAPFRAGNVPKRDLLTMKVPESKDYQLVYDLDLAKLGPTISWDDDKHASINKPFDRIAYFLELQAAGGETQFVYVSMDAFTTSLDKIGIPTVQSSAHFQQKVAKLNIYSNVKGLATGSELNTGSIEFWPNNYGTANAGNIPNASDNVYDFGDEPAEPPDGYGSMQVNNYGAKQTIFALNHWREGAKADLGIGNQPSGNPDWTFAGNAGEFSRKRLRVLVRCKD